VQTLSLATLVAAGMAQAAESASDEQTLTVDASSSLAEDRSGRDYTTPVTRAGTKMMLTTRDIPQSVTLVTRQRIADQQLHTLDAVLSNTTGIRGVSADMDRTNYYSRGFIIDNYMVDGIPTAFTSRWNLGDAQTDMALYERVEVVRGATGLLTGPGNPSAAINMVRKHANSKIATGSLEASYGSWDKQRYVADLSAPLTPTGDVRGRLVAGYENKNSFIERYGFDKKFLYGVVDADLTASTAFSAGYEFTQVDTDSTMWGGAPRWYRDGSQIHLRRGYNSAPEWAYNNKQNRKVFVNLQQNFANGWNITLNGTHNQMLLDSKQIYLDGYFDKVTGAGSSAYASYPVIGGTGYNSGKRTVDAVDAFASGPYELAGRQHQLMLGMNYSRQKNNYYSAWTNISSADLGNFNTFNGNIPQPDWSPREPAADSQRVQQKSAYMATRLTLADPLHLIIGARYTRWQRQGLNLSQEENNTTPYGGVIWDISEAWSAFASYTSVFQPQDYLNAQGSFLSPVVGRNYEAGIKSDWFDSRLTTTLSLFRTELDNAPVDTGRYSDSGNAIYDTTDGVVSRGVEFELNGALSDNWQMTLGGTTYIAENGQGRAYNSQLPRTSLNLFTSYRLPAFDKLTLGGGVNWQSKTYKALSGPEGNGTWYVRQGSYALVDLFARYNLTSNLSLQANLNNLFDKAYDKNVGSSGIVYGEPRSYSVTASYRF